LKPTWAREEGASAVLELKQVDVHYGHVHAVKEVSFRVDKGETAVLIGSNGAGKTTTLHAISGLIPISAGEIWLEGQRVDAMPAHLRVKSGLIQVPEARQVFPNMSVLENLDLGGYFCREAKELRRRLDSVFTLFPRLAERQKQTAGTLSGGEQQMVAIGRALMAQPRLLMLDEPSLGLAPVIIEQIFDVIEAINESGTTLLMVEQNAQIALAIADRGYVLETGRIVLSGDAESLQNDDALRQAYLGH
jgi:branched-chain amino acid transport system ATP-binding protein